MSMINNQSSSNDEGHEKAQEKAIASISLCGSRQPFPLETPKQWRTAFDFLDKRITGNIYILSGRCGGGNMVHPVMDAKLTLHACNVADNTFAKIEKFKVVAKELAESDPESESHWKELEEMEGRLRKAVQEAKGRVGL